jgi:hypothetical protein
MRKYREGSCPHVPGGAGKNFRLAIVSAKIRTGYFPDISIAA